MNVDYWEQSWVLYSLPKTDGRKDLQYLFPHKVMDGPTDLQSE